MNLLCRLLGHKWVGCKCVYCGQLRNEGHQWQSVPAKCSKFCAVCGSEYTIPHEWNGCICNNCGAKRDEQHEWQYIAENSCEQKCVKCGKIHIGKHDFGDWGCVCIRCHEKSNLGLPNHKWTYLNGCTEICEICGRKREEHEWVYFKEDSCEQKCSKCGKLSSYENHEKWQPMDGCKMKCSRCGEITEDIQAHDWETIEEHIDRGGNGYIIVKCKKCGKQGSFPCYGH